MYMIGALKIIRIIYIYIGNVPDIHKSIGLHMIMIEEDERQKVNSQ